MDPQREGLLRSVMAFQRESMAVLQGLDIHVGEFVAMLRISGARGGELAHARMSVNMSDIRDELNVSKPAISQMMNNLERRGFVRREIDPSDRRKVTVELTDTGQQAIESAKRYIGGIFSHVLDEFGAEDTEKFIGLLRRMTELIRQATQGGRGGDNI